MLVAGVMLVSCTSKEAVSPEEARAIAKEAYIYGFPMVDNYRILHAYFVNTDDPEFKGPPNQIANTGRVYTPEMALPEEMAALHKALHESDADVAAGRLVDADEILEELRPR